jgi:peptidoglycan-associated lipoprotein
MDRWVAGLLLVLFMSMLSATPGCSSKKTGADLAGVDGAGLDEEALRDGRAGSLELARSGQLGAEGLPSGPLADVYFDFDSFDLDDEARRILKANADWLGTRPNVRVEIEGHCDERGTIEYNLALGAKRAAAAKTYLGALGISPDRVTTISYGEELPVCHEPTESCWSRNRRAHFVVVGN